MWVPGKFGNDVKDGHDGHDPPCAWPSSRACARDLLHAHVRMASSMLMRVKKATLTSLNGDPFNEAHARGHIHAHARE